jgi:hypothetical protein
MSLNLAVLKTEIQTDPGGVGYATALAAGDNSELARLINEFVTTDDIDVPEVDRVEYVKAVVDTEVAALVADATRLEAWKMILTLDRIPAKDPNLRLLRVLAWPTGGAGTTRAALKDLQDRKAFRSEVFDGADIEFGRQLTHQDIGKALSS